MFLFVWLYLLFISFLISNILYFEACFVFISFIHLFYKTINRNTLEHSREFPMNSWLLYTFQILWIFISIIFVDILEYYYFYIPGGIFTDFFTNSFRTSISDSNKRRKIYGIFSRRYKNKTSNNTFQFNIICDSYEYENAY